MSYWSSSPAWYGVTSRVARTGAVRGRGAETSSSSGGSATARVGIGRAVMGRTGMARGSATGRVTAGNGGGASRRAATTEDTGSVAWRGDAPRGRAPSARAKPVAMTVIFTSPSIRSSTTEPKMMLASGSAAACAIDDRLVRPRAASGTRRR